MPSVVENITQMTGKMLLGVTLKNQECWRWGVCQVPQRKPVWEISYKAWSYCSVSLKALHCLLPGHLGRSQQTFCTAGYGAWVLPVVVPLPSYRIHLMCCFLLKTSWLLGWFQHTRKTFPSLDSQIKKLCVLCAHKGVSTGLHRAVLPSAAWCWLRVLLCVAKAWSHLALQQLEWQGAPSLWDCHKCLLPGAPPGPYHHHCPLKTPQADDMVLRDMV